MDEKASESIEQSSRLYAHAARWQLERLDRHFGDRNDHLDSTIMHLISVLDLIQKYVDRVKNAPSEELSMLLRDAHTHLLHAATSHAIWSHLSDAPVNPFLIEHDTQFPEPE